VNTIYSFHNYQPGPFHCQKRRELADQSTYYYPGYIPLVRPAAGQALDFNLAHYPPEEARFWNRAQLQEEFAAPIRFRQTYQVPLFCGEFGCVSDVPPMSDMMYLMDEISIFQEQAVPWTMYNTMYRTNDPWWRSHFDCGIYIDYALERELLRYGRKIALLRFFCAHEGKVLRLEQPADGWVGLYGLREQDGLVHLLVSNKSREHRAIRLQVGAVGNTCACSTMGADDNGFNAQADIRPRGGGVELALSPLTLTWLRLPGASVLCKDANQV